MLSLFNCFWFLIFVYIRNNAHFIYKNNDTVMDELNLGSVLTNCQIDAATDRNNLIVLDRNKCGDPQYLSNMMKRYGAELHPSFHGSSHISPTPPKSRSTSRQRSSRKRKRQEYEDGNDENEELVNQQLDNQQIQPQQQFDVEFDVPAVYDDAAQLGVVEDHAALQSDETPQDIDDAIDTDDNDEYGDIDTDDNDDQNNIGVTDVKESKIQVESLPSPIPVARAQHLIPPPPLPPPFPQREEESEEIRNDDEIITEPPKKKARRTAEYIFKHNQNTTSKRVWWLCSQLSLLDYDS